MKIKTSELQGPALDWAVAKCAGREIDGFGRYGVVVWELDALTGDKEACCLFTPSTHWSQGGPIIEREGINTFKHNKLNNSEPDTWCGHKVVPRSAMDMVEYSAALAFDGPTPLIAAMRCYVASKLGNEVDVPDELV